MYVRAFLHETKNIFCDTLKGPFTHEILVQFMSLSLKIACVNWRRFQRDLSLLNRRDFEPFNLDANLLDFSENIQ